MYVDKGGADNSGPFPHYEAKPDAIETSAEGLDRHASNIQAFSTELDARHQAALANVSGVIADPMSTATQVPNQYSSLMVGRTYVSSGSIRLFGQGVQRFNTTIDQLNEQYHQAKASDFGVGEAAYPQQATRAERNEIDGARDDQVMSAQVALLRTLIEQYEAARVALDQDAETSATQITAGPTDETLQNLYAAGVLPTSVVAAYPNLTFTAQTLPPDLADLTPEELAEYAVDHPERASELVALLPEPAKQLLGEAIAERAEGVGKDPSQLKQDIESLDRLLSSYGQDSVVATSFLNTIGPDGLLELNGKLATAMLDTNDLPEGHPNQDQGGEFDGDLGASVGMCQISLSRVLAAGTSGQPADGTWNGEGSSTYVSAEWNKELIVECEKKFTIVADGTNVETEIYGYQLLGPLLSEGDHSSAFLNQVGSSMVSFELDYVREHGIQPWMDQTDLGAPADGVRLDWMHGTDDTTNPAGWDPVTGLMRGLANDPDASRDFFAADATSDDPYARLDYLLTDRVWGADAPWFGSGTETPATGTSTLGDALKSATLDGPDDRSVGIVEAIVREYAIDEEAKGYSNATPEEGESPEDAVAKAFANQTLIDPELVPALGDIAAQYIGSFNQSLSPDPSDAPGYMFDDAAFTDSHAQRFLAELGKDPETAGLLSASSRSYAAFDLHRQLSMAPPDMYSEVVNKVSESSGAVTGAIDFGATAAIKAGHEFADKEFNEGVTRGFQLAKAMKGMIPMPPLVSSGLDALLGEYEKTMKHDHIGVANYETGALIEKGEQQQQDFLRMTIWNSIPADQLPPGFEPGVDPMVQMKDNEQLKTAYQQWALNNNHGKMLYSLDAKEPYGDGYERAKSKLQGWDK